MPMLYYIFLAVENPFEAAVTPMLLLVGALATVYCIFLGVKLATASEPQEQQKAKSHLKNAIIGFVLIFVLIVALHVGMEPMTQWMEAEVGTISTDFN